MKVLLAAVLAVGALPAFAQTGGAPLTADTFRVRRAVPAGEPGLVALVVDASMLAESRGPSARFGDVRILEAGGTQVPYLIERRREPMVLNLQLQPFQGTARDLQSEAGRSRSVYAVRLPYDRLPSMRLELETPARVFNRFVRIGFERKPDRHRRDPWFEEIASMTWQHTNQNSAAFPLNLKLPEARGTELLIVVDERENATLPISAVRAVLPAYRLRFHHTGRPLQLLYGRDDLTAPQYDLALVEQQIMSADARQITATLREDVDAAAAIEPVPQSYLWAGLGVAVLILLALIARLVTRAS